VDKGRGNTEGPEQGEKTCDQKKNDRNPYRSAKRTYMNETLTGQKGGIGIAGSFRAR